MRYTQQATSMPYTYNVVDTKKVNAAIDKLGKYEDYDERVGLEYSLLAELIDRDFVFVKDKDGKILKVDIISINMKKRRVKILDERYGQSSTLLYFCDYGNEWSLWSDTFR